MSGKIKSVEELIDISEKLKEDGKVIVTTNGCFDILHCAHINLIERAKGEGDLLIVLVNSDDSIRKLKGDKRPIIPENERVRMLAALGAVDYVTVFDDETPLSILEKIKPDAHVKGGSSNKEPMLEEKSLLESLGSKHIILPIEDGFSTTNVIEKVLGKYKG